jgi:anti-anti-sigma factor
MDSASAGTLMRISQEMREEGGRVVLYGVQRLISRMLDAAGLAAVFDVAADETAARSLLA